MGLAGPCAPLRATCLAGGVSSDIWRVDLESGPICVKRALARLRVQAEWRAPLERNVYEARWMRRAGSACPGSAPELLGHDPETGMLAMAYLPPQSYPLWKDQLRAGLAEPAFAAKVGERLACIHAATASDPAVAAEFPSAAIFEAIRIEPYLIASAEAHPGLASRLGELAEVTRRTRRALVHGDVSPKNILAGPTGPVFLDAECALLGRPRFRPRLLPQSPAAEMPVDTKCEGGLPRLFRGTVRPVSGRRRVGNGGRTRSSGGKPPAGASPGADRREITG